MLKCDYFKCGILNFELKRVEMAEAIVHDPEQKCRVPNVVETAAFKI
jgi:hypothetical protein